MKKIIFVLAATTILPANVFGKSALAKIEHLKNKVERAIENNQTRPFKELLQKAHEDQKELLAQGKSILHAPLVISNDAKITNAESEMRNIEQNLNTLFWSKNIIGLKRLQCALETSKETAQAELRDQIINKYGTTKSPLLLFASDLNKEDLMLQEYTNSLIKLAGDSHVKSDKKVKSQVQKLLDDVINLKKQLGSVTDVANKVLAY